MTVDTFGVGGKDAQTFEASRVVVRDEFGNPLVIAVEHAPGKYLLSHCQDPEFEDLARALGYDPAVVQNSVQL